MIYFAADIHLGAGSRAEAQATEQRFVAWLDEVARDAEAIVLVGDIFDFWFEYRRVVPKGCVRTLGKLAELTDRGIRIILFTGNHDMWVGDYLATECGVELYTSPREMTLCGKRLFIAHGDNMNIGGQWLLQAMNATFRSRVARVLFSWLVHPDLAMKFGRWWSGKSRKSHNAADERAATTGKGHGFGPHLTEPLIEYARRYAATHHIDHFIFGHMHVARDYREEGLHTIHLGGWEKDAAYATLDTAGNLTLKRL